MRTLGRTSLGLETGDIGRNQPVSDLLSGTFTERSFAMRRRWQT